MSTNSLRAQVDDGLSLPVREASPGLSFADRLGRLAVRQYALCTLLVMLVAGFNVFAGLGQSRIDDSDEARYGVSAYEMVHGGSLLVTTYAGQPEYWNLKPPLGYWLLALSFRLFGASPFTLRLPSALFALATVALVMAFSRRHLNRRAALIAGLITATCFGFLSHHGARSGDLDSALTFLLLLAASLIPRLAGSAGRTIAFWTVLAAGFLLKSFAILPMALVAALYLAWTGSWRRLRWGACLAGAALFVAVAAGWAAARWHADGSPYFLQRMVGEDLFARSLHEIDKGSSYPWSYLGSLFDRFAPWPLLLAAAAFLAVRTQGRGGWQALGPKARRVAPLLALWIGVPLLLFSAARTHHHWYLDPVYPALAVVTAGAILWLLRRVSPERRSAAVCLLLVLPLALCEARALDRVLVRDRMPESQRFLLSLADHRWEVGPDLHAATPLYHSERFILVAMAGYRVVEGAGDGPPAGADPDMPLLVRNPAPGAPAPFAIPAIPEDLDVLAAARAFTLYGNRELALEAARLRPPEGWKAYRRPHQGRGRSVRRS